MSKNKNEFFEKTIKYQRSTNVVEICEILPLVNKELKRVFPGKYIELKENWQRNALIIETDECDNIDFLSQVAYKLRENCTYKNKKTLDLCWIRNELLNDEQVKNKTTPYSERLTTYENKTVKPKTVGQKKYYESLEKNVVTFCEGPAGTGKTWLAVAYAVEALKKSNVKRIIMTRPVVEASGEHLGFLPGGINEKLDPYIRPLFDSLKTLAGTEKTQRWLDDGTIEIAPLAYMRGRTFDNSIVIADEMQNATYDQLKMLLTRLGYDTKCIITGDITQKDRVASNENTCGLILAKDICLNAKIPDIGYVKMSSNDIVRSPIAAYITEAYAEAEKE